MVGSAGARPGVVFSSDPTAVAGGLPETGGPPAAPGFLILWLGVSWRRGSRPTRPTTEPGAARWNLAGAVLLTAYPADPENSLRAARAGQSALKCIDQKQEEAAMTAKIHCLITGALESSYRTSVYGAPERHPLVSKEELVPHGYKERSYNADGSFSPGLMVPVPTWLIEGEGKVILIDTGLGDCDEIMSMQNNYGIDYIATKSKDEEIVTALGTKGLTPADIDIVVLTHLHFDHIGNNELFSKARFIVQEDEVPFLISPPPFATFYYREWQHKLTSISDRLYHRRQLQAQQKYRIDQGRGSRRRPDGGHGRHRFGQGLYRI